MSQIIVKAKRGHMRGTTVYGLAGRRYMVDAETLALHPCDASGERSPEAFVHEEDAAEFRQFPSDFEVPKAAPASPPKPLAVKAPPPPPKKLPSVVEPVPPAEEGSEEIEWPEPKQLSIEKWLALAAERGIELTDEEKATTPKAALVEIIKSKV